MSRDINVRIARVLGIDPNVLSFDLSVRYGGVPRLTITTCLKDAAQVEPATGVFDFTLREEEPQPFDLEQACDAALARLSDLVSHLALKAEIELQQSCNRRLREIWA